MGTSAVSRIRRFMALSPARCQIALIMGSRDGARDIAYLPQSSAFCPLLWEIRARIDGAIESSSLNNPPPTTTACVALAIQNATNVSRRVVLPIVRRIVTNYVRSDRPSG